MEIKEEEIVLGRKMWIGSAQELMVVNSRAAGEPGGVTDGADLASQKTLCRHRSRDL